jgi:NADH-quinone oxidoreductase subunit A
MTPLAAYLLLFVAVGVGFIFVHLMAGKFIRPNKPDPAKGTIYECGEPTIGSAWIQFDLRFYVVALLFVIFDVEVAFFFPWAVVFGKANTISAIGQPTSAEHYQKLAEQTSELLPPAAYANHITHLEQLQKITPQDLARQRELRQKWADLRQADPKAQLSPDESSELDRLNNNEQTAVRTVAQARDLGWLALVEILVFFGVLLIGFAYLWHRGDLAWVRSLAAERSASEPTPPRGPLSTRQSAPEPLTSTYS